VLVVAGEVERNGTGQITEVLQLDADPEAVRAAWPVPPPGDDYCVTQIDRQSVATDTCFEVLFGGEEGRSETASLFLVLDEAEDADTVKLELRLGADGRVVDTIVESANDPVVRVLSPNGGQEWTGPGPIRWEVSDPDGDELALSVLYSEDGGASWEPISVGLESSGGVVDAPVQGEFEWDSSRFAGSDNALVRVTASDGLRTVSDESDAPFRLNENGPAVSIEAPLDGARFVHSGQVILRGQAFDPEDGSLAGSSLAWRVDERGWVGAGDEVVAPRLSWGNHVVTLTATDSSGRTSSASVRIRVDVRAWIPSVRQR
jgi:hypothetical protein